MTSNKSFSKKDFNAAAAHGMIYLPDVNVLIAALHPSHQFHNRALSWLESGIKFATTPITETGFLRLSVNPAVTGNQIEVSDALASLRTLQADRNWRFWPDTSSLVAPMINIDAMIGAKQITDFQLVNLAAVNHGKLVTFDGRIPKALNSADRNLVQVLVP